MDELARIVAKTLETGLPVLLMHFGAALALLAVGSAIYIGLTPFAERRLAAEGNVAAGAVLGGTVVALSIPLAATLATSGLLVDIVLWGVVALIVQLLAFAVAALMIGDLRSRIEAGNLASALTLVGVQIAVALLNAAAMAG